MTGFSDNQKQFTTINAVSSGNLSITHGVPQGSVLGPLLFLIYINDLHKAIINSHRYRFVDDTNLLLINKSPKKINKLMNQDLSKLCKWLQANKISLNVSKTKIILFKTKTNNVTKKFNK